MTYLFSKQYAPSPSLSPGEETISHNIDLFLLAGILSACLPHISYQPVYVLVIAALCLGWRIAYLVKLLPETPKFLQLLIAAAALGFILHGEHYNLGRDAGISLLVAALVIKQIQSYDDANFYFSACLTVFVAAAAFLYSQSLFTFFCVGHSVVFVCLALYAKASPSVDHANYRMVGRLLFYATPLTLVLFFLSPNFDGPLWEMPSDANEAQTGLSSEMAPGKISSLVDSEEVVFRVKFQHMPEDKNAFIGGLYWRGPVLAFFDGQSWQSLGDTLSTPWAQTAASSEKLSDQNTYRNVQQWPQTMAVALAIPTAIRKLQANQYQVTLEPHYNNWLFTLSTPVEVQEGFYLTADDELLTREVVNQPLQYALKVNASNRDHSPPPDGRYLRMPNLYGHKTKLLVKRLQQDLDPDLPYDTQFVSKVLQYFREQPYYYSKRPPLTQYDPVDEFIYKTKTGFCEHYASAFAFMMRAAGIPSRVVTGYLGGEYNAVGDYVIVRQSDAHAWTEVWLHGMGWVRVDPTAVLPPNRVDTSGSDSPYLMAGLIQWDSAALSHFNAWLDTLSYRWYGFLANVFQIRSQDWISWIFYEKHYLLMLTALILFVWLAWRLGKHNSPISDPVLRIYDIFNRKLSRRGFLRLEYESASAFAARVCAEAPDCEPQVQSITHLYNQLRYGKNPCATVYKQLCREVGRFRP